MKHDRLFEILHRLLAQDDHPHETAAQLIRRVATQYSIELLAAGDIPTLHMGEVMADLEAEVIEMYRKITYGYFSLREYRQSRSRDRS